MKTQSITFRVKSPKSTAPPTTTASCLDANTLRYVANVLHLLPRKKEHGALSSRKSHKWPANDWKILRSWQATKRHSSSNPSSKHSMPLSSTFAKRNSQTASKFTLFTFPLITLICTDLFCYPYYPWEWKTKGNHEKDSIDIISSLVRLWMSHAHGGVYCPATSRDPSQRAHRFRRDIDFQREFDRDRLSLSLSRVRSKV